MEIKNRNVTVDVQGLLKSYSRFFSDSVESALWEIVHNARRAGATELTAEVTPENGLLVSYNGREFTQEDWDAVMAIGRNNWDLEKETPAGMGFWAARILASKVSVYSAGKRVDVDLENFKILEVFDTPTLSECVTLDYHLREEKLEEVQRALETPQELSLRHGREKNFVETLRFALGVNGLPKHKPVDTFTHKGREFRVFYAKSGLVVDDVDDSDLKTYDEVNYTDKLRYGAVVNEQAYPTEFWGYDAYMWVLGVFTEEELALRLPDRMHLAEKGSQAYSNTVASAISGYLYSLPVGQELTKTQLRLLRLSKVGVPVIDGVRVDPELDTLPRLNRKTQWYMNYSSWSNSEQSYPLEELQDMGLVKLYDSGYSQNTVQIWVKKEDLGYPRLVHQVKGIVIWQDGTPTCIPLEKLIGVRGGFLDSWQWCVYEGECLYCEEDRTDCAEFYFVHPGEMFENVTEFDDDYLHEVLGFLDSECDDRLEDQSFLNLLDRHDHALDDSSRVNLYHYLIESTRFDFVLGDDAYPSNVFGQYLRTLTGARSNYDWKIDDCWDGERHSVFLGRLEGSRWFVLMDRKEKTILAHKVSNLKEFVYSRDSSHVWDGERVEVIEKQTVRAVGGTFEFNVDVE